MSDGSTLYIQVVILNVATTCYATAFMSMLVDFYYNRSAVKKHYTNLGKQTVKRAVNAHASKGFRAGIKEVKKAAKYYFKSQAKYYKNYFKGLWVDAIPVAHAVGNIIWRKFGRHR